MRIGINGFYPPGIKEPKPIFNEWQLKQGEGLMYLTEGHVKKGGVNPAPTTPKPQIRPPAQKPKYFARITPLGVMELELYDARKEIDRLNRLMPHIGRTCKWNKEERCIHPAMTGLLEEGLDNNDCYDSSFCGDFDKWELKK